MVIFTVLPAHRVHAGDDVHGSATLPAGVGMPFTARFRTTSESSTVENFYLASTIQKNVRQQMKQESVEVKAGTSLSDAFSQKGLRGGSIKGVHPSSSFDSSPLRMRSTSVTSTDSEASLTERSPSASLGSGDFLFRRSASSTPSNSSGLTAGMAQALPPLPTDGPPPQHGGANNPMYGTPSSLPANPLYDTPVSPLPSPSANPLYNSPRAMQEGGNPLYKSPTKSYPPQQHYNIPSSIPVNPGPMYNTLPTRGPRSALLGNTPSSPLDRASPGYDTPKIQLAAADAPAVRQQPDTSLPVGRISRSGSAKSHRSPLLKEISSEDSDPSHSPTEALPPATTVKVPVPKPRPDRKLKEPIPEEGGIAEEQEEAPPPVRREVKPTLNADAPSEGDASGPPPPVNRAQKPHFEPPKPPTVDRTTKPLLATATAIQDDSSDEEDDVEGGEEFGEMPQQSDDTLHYVKLLHLASPPPTIPKPVPKPRRNLPTEAEASMDTEYTMVDKQKTSELSRRLSEIAAAEPSGPEKGQRVQDATVAEQPRYVNLTCDGEVDVENDPQYYTVMTVSHFHGDQCLQTAHGVTGWDVTLTTYLQLYVAMLPA